MSAASPVQEGMTAWVDGVGASLASPASLASLASPESPAHRRLRLWVK